MASEIQNIESTIQERIQSVSSQLPADCIEVQINPGPNATGIEVKVIPRNTRSAQVTVWAENGNQIVTVWLGRSTIIEILPNNRGSIVDFVQAVCEEAFAGRFGEELWLVDDVVSKCFGSITVHGISHVYRYYAVSWNMLGRKNIVKIQYEPYS